MNIKHTPGPWTVHSCEVHPHHEIIAECGRRIATQNDYHDGQDKANARLIAAAPELLDALKEARSMLETASRYFPKSIHNSDRFSLLNVLANTVNPAIAKAEGEEQWRSCIN